MTDDSQQVWPIFCGPHPQEPAIAMCTVCGQFICADCRRVDDHGLAQCGGCSGDRTEALTPFERPEIGGLFKRYWATIRHAITEPRDFAATLHLNGRVGPAWVFGFSLSALGKLAAITWVLLLAPPPEFAARLAELSETVQLSPAVVQALVILMGVPMWAAVRLLVCAWLLHVGSSLAGSAERFGYGAYLRLFCFASAAEIFSLVPLMGGVLAFAYAITICGYALSIQLRLSPRQVLFSMAPLVIGMVLLPPIWAG